MKRKEARPEYDQVWHDIYLAGTEWDQLGDVGKVDWDFSHLDEALTADLEATRASMNGMIHMFGSTEPQLIITDKNPAGEVLPIPVIMVIISKQPPPSILGIKSVQRAEEDFVPMEEMKMGWYPILPTNMSSMRFSKKMKQSGAGNVFGLKCERRRAGLKNMAVEDVKKYDYVLPYILFPDRKDNDEQEQDTSVNVMLELPGLNKPLVFEYDWEMDEMDEFVEEKCKEEELDAKEFTEPMKKGIQEQVMATKAKYKAEREAIKKRIDDMSPEQRESLKTMKIVKFYPKNEKPDVSALKTKYINRYYRHAHEVR